jgi:VWFA-related protein
MKFAAIAVLAAMPAIAQIRVTTRLVEVNVIVRDKNGPVRGLAKSDFEVFDRGKTRPIAVFTENTAAPRQAAAPEPLPANVFSNAPERRGLDPASATVVLFDGVNTPLKDQVWAKKQFLAFLGQLRPRDRIAVYSLGRTLRVLSDFTNDTERLAATVASYRGRTDGSPDTPAVDRFETGDAKTDAIWNAFLGQDEADEQDRRVRITAEAVEAIARHIGAIPGRKNLIWVSAAFRFEVYGMFPHTYAPEVNRMARALSGANVAMYPVDARGLVGMPMFSAESARPPGVNALAYATPTGHPVMDMLSGATGGRTFKNTNDVRGALRSVLDDTETTYTLAFSPDANDLDSKFHKLRVQVSRPGVEVHYREGYEAMPDAPVQIAATIGSPLEASGIRLRVTLDRGAKLRFSVVIDSSDISFGLIDAAFVQRSADGRDLGTTFYTLRGDVNAAQREEASRKGLGFAKEIVPVAGAVEVKVVVVDRASGRIGSVFVPLR